MKIPNPFLLAVAAFLTFGALAAPHARAQASAGYFYDSLDPYGEWVSVPDYGYCWHPTGVTDDWAPYTDGYWAYTDSGWTWVSYEDYGGIVYHYGRWARIPGEGWVWAPGYTWAPAWVSWRMNDDYVGWAPLPPEAHWGAGIGFSTWVDARYDIGPGFYSFVSVGNFGAPALGPVIVSRDRNVTIINNTTNITNITNNNSTVYTGGPSYERIAAHSSRPIPTFKLVRQSAAAHGGSLLSRQNGNELMVLAPKMTAPPAGTHPAPHKVAKTLAGAKADHGWDVVKDPAEREKLHARIKDQASGSEDSPAKPVNPDDVKLVSEKARHATKSTEGGPSETSTAETGKGRKSKNEKTDITALENAPATEGSGAAETPKPKKSRKAKTSSEYEYGTSGEETPIPKKSKKAKTPGDYESNDYETPAKHSKKSEDSNLQPFMGGGESSEPKSKKSSENYGDRSTEGGYGAASEEKTSKKEKSDKKSKEEDQGYPPGQ